MTLHNYAIFFTHEKNRSRRVLRYLRAPPDPQHRSESINAFLKPRYPGFLIYEVRELFAPVDLSECLANEMIYNTDTGLYSMTAGEYLRRMKRKIEATIEEVKIRHGEENFKLGVMIHGDKLIRYRVIFKKEKPE